MKCEKCNTNKADFYYSSNINGNVTEKHLCSKCAAEMGLTQNIYSHAGSIFEDMMGSFFGRRSLLSPVFDLSLPAMLFPRIELHIGNGTAPAETEKKAEVETDPELSKRREINMLREQMKKAADEENYEKAAEIKTKITELERSA